MKKIVLMMAALFMLGMTDADAQGFLKKLKQKAQQVMTVGQSEDEGSETQSSESEEPADPSNLVVAQGSDIVPKRKTATITWDGTVTPSSASTASALMRELPELPSAEKMARSTMEEREAYTMKIAAVLTRAEQLEKNANGCSDAEIERFEKMSEKEQEAYIQAHPEFMQKMMKMAQNAGNMAKQAKQMTAALSGYEAKIGLLTTKYQKFLLQESKHDYSSIAKKYNTKLKKMYDQICATDDADRVDALYAEADEMLYKYRLEAAKEYRASLQRQMAEAKKFAAEYDRLTQEVVNSGDLPECAIGRTDLNAVIMTGNLLDDAYKELPELEAQPVCRETIYKLPEGWSFGVWECRGYMGVVEEFKAGSSWPLLADNRSGDRTEWGVVENGKFRKIDESELKRINKQADQRVKSASKNKPPYGTYKSRSGQRVVEYSKTGELIVNGMTSYAPVAFTAKDNMLVWIILDGSQIVKCTYKL